MRVGMIGHWAVIVDGRIDGCHFLDQISCFCDHRNAKKYAYKHKRDHPQSHDF